jgi:hypothetical protein
MRSIVQVDAATGTAMGDPNCSAFCADVTKLLAADSFLGTFGLQDPEAESAFSTLTSLLANPVETSFFHRAHLLEQQLGPVGKYWKASSRFAEPRASQSIIMDQSKAFSFARIFKGDEALRAVSWLRFQSSDALLRVFWQDNREEDLRQTYVELSAANLTLSDLRSAVHNAQRDQELHFHHSCMRIAAELEKPLKYVWDDQSIAIAYLAWSYIKGFRYVTGLSPTDVYAVHFTREHAVDPRSSWATQIGSNPFGLFPWGDLIAPHCRPNLGIDYATAVMELRDYSRANLGPYLGALDAQRPYLAARHSHDARHAFRRAMAATKDFAKNGLVRALPSRASGQDFNLMEKATMCWHVVCLLGLVRGGGLEVLPELYIEVIALTMPHETKAAIVDDIHMLKSRWELHQALSEKADIMESFLHQHGIDRGLW